MNYQDLLGLVNNLRSQGYSNEQIYDIFQEKGYPPDFINQALSQMSVRTVVHPTKIPNGVVLMVIICFFVIAGAILYEQKDNLMSLMPNIKKADKNTITPYIFVPAPTEKIIEQKPIGEVILDANCDQLSDKLESCTAYRCQFIHSLTNDKLVKEIKGLANGKCSYVEQMPNNGKMECNYTELLRNAAAAYYRVLYNTGTYGTEIKDDLASNAEFKYTIDGKEVTNPIQEALTNGQCAISGF